MKRPQKAGVFGFQLFLRQLSEQNEIDYKSIWGLKPAKRVNMVKIRAYIYKCQNLPAPDGAEGTPHPCIKIWDFGNTQKKTKVVEDNVNPEFMSCLELDYFVINQNSLISYPPILLDVFGHYDKLFDRTPFFQCRSII